MSAEAARPGLSELAYRPGTYATFRRAMIEGLSRPGGLTRLTSRRGDDYAITLISLWAAVADVLAFYQERYANEAFLGTATRQESVARLAALLDYRLGPGAAALVRLAFTLEPKKAAALEPGLRVQSLPGPGELPQVFETLEPLAADARLNRLRVFPAPVTATLAAGQTTLTLNRSRGPEIAAGLAAGARIVLFKDNNATPLEEKIVADVRAEDDRMVVEWTEPVKATAWASGGLAYPFTRTLRLFGHAAPPTFMEPSELSSGGLGLATKTKALQAIQQTGGNQFLANPSSQFGGGSSQALPRIVWNLRTLAPAYPRSGNAEEAAVESGTSRLCLDGRYDGLAAGAKLLVADTKPGGTKRLVTIQNVDQVHDVHGPLADTVTRVTVSPSVGSLADRRTVVVFELGRRARALERALPGPGHRRHRLPSRPPRRGRSRGRGRSPDRRRRAGGRSRAASGGARGRPGVRALGRDVSRRRAPQGAADDHRRGRRGLLPSRAPAGRRRDARPRRGLGRPDGERRSRRATASRSATRWSEAATRRRGSSASGSPARPSRSFPGQAEGGLESTLELLVDGVRWTEVPTLFGQPPDARVFTGAPRGRRQDGAPVRRRRPGRAPPDRAGKHPRVVPGRARRRGASRSRPVHDRARPPARAPRRHQPAAGDGRRRPRDARRCAPERADDRANVRPGGLAPGLRGSRHGVRRGGEGAGDLDVGRPRPVDPPDRGRTGRRHVHRGRPPPAHERAHGCA